MNKIALITGAGSGIGKSCAEALASEQFNLILVARRKHTLLTLKDELESKYNIQCMIIDMDIRNKKKVFENIEKLSDDWKYIDILINNAGLALEMNSIDEGDTDDWDIMIDTNIKGLLYVSKAVIPLMKKSGKGHIINIGSIAGKEVYPKGNVYCSTKYAVDAISKSMRIDLLSHNIKVTQVAPGAVETEFSLVRYKGDLEKANAVYQGFIPLTPKDVAEVVLFCISRPRHVNINDVLVMPTQQAAAGIFNKTL